MAEISEIPLRLVGWLLSLDKGNAKAILDGNVEQFELGFERVPRPVYWLFYLPLLAFLIYLIWWNYRREPDHLPQRRRRQLSWLRTGGALTLFVVFLGPYLHLQVIAGEKRTMVVLLDKSRSMGLVDKRSENAEFGPAARAAGLKPYGAKDNNTVSDSDKAALKSVTRFDLAHKLLFNSDLDLIKNLEAMDYNVDVRVFDSGAPLRLAAQEGPPKETDFQTDLARPTGDQTSLGSALRNVADELSKRGAGQILVLSDFNTTAGEPPTQVAGDTGIPIFTVAMALPAAKDVEMVFLTADELVFVEDIAPVNVRLRINGFADRDITVVVNEVDAATPDAPGLEVSRKTVTIGNEHDLDLSLEYKPKQKGDFILKAFALPLEGEASTQNNTKSRPIKVTDQKIKVLLIENEPSWEWRYMKNGLKRDRRVEVAMILFGGDRDIVGGDFLSKLPTREDLLKYDLLVIGNVPRERFSDKDLENFVEFVTHENGSIWLLAGKNHMPMEYKGTPLEQLIPVELGNAPIVTPSLEKDQPYTDPFFATLTIEGRNHPLMRLDDQPARNAQLWSQFPALFWYLPDKGAKPSAQILLQHSVERDRMGRPATLMAFATVGRGRVLYQSFRDLWRMRYQPGPAHLDKFYGRAAQQLGLPHLIKGKSRRLELNLDPTTVALGGQVKVSARILDETYHPSVKERHRLLVNYTAANKTEPVDLEPVSGQPGYFHGTFVAGEQGTAVCKIDGMNEDGTNLEVRRSDPEMDSPYLDEESFINIAKASHARHFRMDELDQLFEGDTLQSAGRKARTNTTDPIWDSPLFLILFVTFFCLSWYLRKRSDLL